LHVQITSEEVKTISSCSEYSYQLKNKSFLTKRKLGNAEAFERGQGTIHWYASKRQVAQRFGCTVRTIHRLWNRFNQTGSTSDRPRSGSPRVTTPGRTVIYGYVIYGRGFFAPRS